MCERSKYSLSEGAEAEHMRMHNEVYSVMEVRNYNYKEAAVQIGFSKNF